MKTQRKPSPTAAGTLTAVHRGFKTKKKLKLQLFFRGFKVLNQKRRNDISLKISYKCLKLHFDTKSICLPILLNYLWN